MMGSCIVVALSFFVGLCFVSQCSAGGVDLTARLSVTALGGRPIPETFSGIFLEEIVHAGAGGIWAELVRNRGFEAGGPNTPSNIDPWTKIGDDSSLIVSTDRSSCFERNKVALQMDVLCDSEGSNICPAGGVGIYNPGFWGMNIEQGKTYRVILYVRSLGPINVSVSFTSSDGLQKLVTAHIIFSASEVVNWSKAEVLLKAQGTDHNARLQLTTSRKGLIWFDQVSAMPLDTFKGHGFRKDLFGMLAAIKPTFLRLPGGSSVEGDFLRNAFRWKETIGPWEERPGHWGDVWMYWTDDGIGYFEFLQLAEDLGALPIWVFNAGISHHDEVDTSKILPFVQEALDGIAFAIDDHNSTWGSVRAAMGHPEPFDLRYVAVGNEDCGKENYRGNYLKFYENIKSVYPNIKIISNCDGSSSSLDHPADYFDYHIYTSAEGMFSLAHKFDNTSRSGPKAFVSEYAVQYKDCSNGSLSAAIAEAGFLTGLEINSDVVEMASYAPLPVNTHDLEKCPEPAGIVFNSTHLYGSPVYWMQYFFKESNGATLLNATLQSNFSSSLIASAIIWKDSNNTNYLRIKVVNFESSIVSLNIKIEGLGLNSIKPSRSTMTVLTSTNPMDGNSFGNPKKVAPIQSQLDNAGKNMDVVLAPWSLTAIDLLTELDKYE